jgi:hypothetical protein
LTQFDTSRSCFFSATQVCHLFVSELKYFCQTVAKNAKMLQHRRLLVKLLDNVVNVESTSTVRSLLVKLLDNGVNVNNSLLWTITGGWRDYARCAWGKLGTGWGCRDVAVCVVWWRGKLVGSARGLCSACGALLGVVPTRLPVETEALSGIPRCAGFPDRVSVCPQAATDGSCQ